MKSFDMPGLGSIAIFDSQRWEALMPDEAQRVGLLP
jgi:hypothetical protein